MDAPCIDDRVNQALAGLGWRRFARRIGAPMLAAMLALAAGTAMAADGHAHPVSPVSPLAAGTPDGAMPDPAASSALNAFSAHTRPAIRPVLSDEIRLAALQEGKRLRSMPPGAALAPMPAARPVEDNLVMASHSKASVAADGAVAYALVTDITRTRVASELRQQLMGSSATIGDLPGAPRTDLMQVGTGWRAVVWPFATEVQADKARRLLAERGIRTELLKF
jgi:hypothetical protein